MTAGSDPASPVECPSCAAMNPARNQFCEHCGWRLAAEVPHPSRAGWATGALAAAVLGGAVWIFVGLSGDSAELPGRAVADVASSSSVVSPTVVRVSDVRPISVLASSELDGFEASHLIDGDLGSTWNDASLRGEGAELTFTFAPAITLTEAVLHMPTDEESFFLNARIRGVELSFSDSSEVIVTELSDEPGPHRISIPSITTTQVALRVTSTYAAVSFGGHEPYEQLAVAEVGFRGRPASS